MKKILSLVFLLALLTACGSKDVETETPDVASGTIVEEEVQTPVTWTENETDGEIEKEEWTDASNNDDTKDESNTNNESTETENTETESTNDTDEEVAADVETEVADDFEEELNELFDLLESSE